MAEIRELAPRPTPEQFADLARAVEANADVISTRRLMGGISCRMDVLKYSSGKKQHEVVVRQYGPWHEDDDPHPGTFETTVLKLLGENGVAAPSLILDRAATKIMGNRTVVTSFIDGRADLNADDLDDWSGQLVSAISKVHNVPLALKIRKLIPSLYTGLDRLFTRSDPPEYIAQHPLGHKLWQTARDRWPYVGKPEDHLVHADYWPGNTLWKDDRLVAIVDWEEPRLGEPTYDIATVVQDSAYFGIDVEDAVVRHHRQMSGRILRDFDFWRMVNALNAMPDPGVWVSGYQALGGGPITPEEVRANHTASIERMLADA
jgi:aminoglycoside phosphotransferase (APT) family kinase protein